MKTCRNFSQIATVSLMLWCSAGLHAQTAGRLYDPEPPVDSAYVRVMLAGDLGNMAVSVDDKVRIPQLASRQASDYMVLTSGKHQLTLKPAAKSAHPFSVPLDVVPGRAFTVVFTPAEAALPPTVIEDKTGSNKLKAMLSVYQFASKKNPLDVYTTDGKTKVFGSLAYGTAAAIAVNPIQTELLIRTGGETDVLGKVAIGMTQGNAYSIILMPEKGGKAKSVVVENRVERYTGN